MEIILCRATEPLVLNQNVPNFHTIITRSRPYLVRIVEALKINPYEVVKETPNMEIILCRATEPLVLNQNVPNFHTIITRSRPYLVRIVEALKINPYKVVKQSRIWR